MLFRSMTAHTWRTGWAAQDAAYFPAASCARCGVVVPLVLMGAAPPCTSDGDADTDAVERLIRECGFTVGERPGGTANA